MTIFHSLPVLESWGVTDVGCRRSVNEDAILDLRDHGIFCLADGVGGSVNGKRASQEVVDCVNALANVDKFHTNGDTVASLKTAMSDANTNIRDIVRTKQIKSMGSTVIILNVDLHRESVTIMHAGDSRAYRYRDNVLFQLTTDHSVAAEMGLTEFDTIPPGIEGKITRAVGLRDDLTLETTVTTFRENDIYLLCSDGLDKHLTTIDISEILSSCSIRGVKRTAERLIKETKRRGAFDNVSVILIRVAKRKRKPLLRPLSAFLPGIRS